MISTILLIALCAAVGYFIWKNSTSAVQIPTREISRLYSRNEIRIENIGPGSVIRLTGIGPDQDNFDLKVVAKHTYKQGNSFWYEIECDKGAGEKVWIDMEEDDELEFAISLRELKLDDLGITKQDLTRMDDEERGDFDFEGQKYSLEDSDGAVFYKYSEDRNAEEFYYWDFEATDGRHFISVERWSDGSYDVTYSEAVKPSQVTVIK